VEAYFLDSRASAEKFPGEVNGKKYRKIALISTLFPGRRPTMEKKTENSKKHQKKRTFKPLYYICTMYENSRGTASCQWHIQGTLRPGTRNILAPPFNKTYRV